MKKTITLFAALTASLSSFSATWYVGPTRTYTTPSQVKLLVADGDSIKIDGGVYLNDPTKWVKKDLKFVGLGTGTNRTIMRWNAGDIPNGKGIWVFEQLGISDNPSINNIVFDGARVSDGNGGNGAGIRYQSSNLKINNCKFVNCQNGILEGGAGTALNIISITNTEFENNGYETIGGPYSGYEHNIYISGGCDTLYVKNCYFHDPRGEANSLKTRAKTSYIINNIIDENQGQGSWELNIAQGGLCIVVGNVIIQGPNSINHGIISIDAANNPINELYFINNTVINKYPVYANCVQNFAGNGMTVFKFRNNVFAGVSGASLNKFGTPPASLDTANNRWITDHLTVGFISPSTNNYSITASAASLVDKGVSPGNASNGYNLTPSFMYKNFTNTLIPRTVGGSAIDIGAYEYSTATTTSIFNNIFDDEISVYPNPTKNKLHIINANNCNVIMTDILGKNISFHSSFENNDMLIELNNIVSGVYFLTLTLSDKVITKKIIVE